jgi:hypothetical protein
MPEDDSRDTLDPVRMTSESETRLPAVFDLAPYLDTTDIAKSGSENSFARKVVETRDRACG